MQEEITIEQLCELFIRTVNSYTRLEKETHTFGAGVKLRLSEVHTITAVGSHENINITNLAKMQGISKSAVSQMVSKLVQKGFIEKRPSPETENEVVLFLTMQGREVQEAHERQHVLLRKQLESIFSHYPEGTVNTLASLAAELQNVWDSRQ